MRIRRLATATIATVLVSMNLGQAVIAASATGTDVRPDLQPSERLSGPTLATGVLLDSLGAPASG